MAEVRQLGNIVVVEVSQVQSGVAAEDIVCVVDNPAEDIAVVVGLIVEVVANLVDADIEVDRLVVAALLPSFILNVVQWLSIGDIALQL